MQVDRGTEIEVSREELSAAYRIFGPKSLFIDSLRIEKDTAGSVGTRAIGSWVIPEHVTEDHIADFTTESGIEVIGLRLLPGHYWAEALGQTLGGLAFFRYPRQIVEILPMFREQYSRYREAAFVGSRIDLCVEFLNAPEQDQERLKLLKGRGVAVHKGHLLATVDPIVVRIGSLKTSIELLQKMRDEREAEPENPTTFKSFPTSQ